MKNTLEAAPGQQRGWNLLEKIGEGDAGEVYLVESLLDHRSAILKRPSRSSFASDLVRQASQIQREAEVLIALGLNESPAGLMRAPSLIDRSRTGTEFSERFFIVISAAPGFSLEQIRRSIHFKMTPEQPTDPTAVAHITPVESFFQKELITLGKLPDLLLLRAAAGLLEYLEAAHTAHFETPTGVSHGIIWNDIKPEHIYWDPISLRFTLIDWGNAQFLESDGITKDRQHSRMSDLDQYILEIGRLIADSGPKLYSRLTWPSKTQPGNTYSDAVRLLKQQIEPLLQAELSESFIIRRNEANLLNLSDPAPADFVRLNQLQIQMIAKGEMPDFQASSSFFQKVGSAQLREGKFVEFLELSRLASQAPILDPGEQHLLEELILLHSAGSIPGDVLLPALLADWDEAHWELRLAALDQPESEWWLELSREIRFMATGTSNLQPLVAAKRLNQALRSVFSSNQSPNGLEAVIDEYNRMLKRWIQLEPDPPDSGIAYSDSESIIQRASNFAPEAAQHVFNTLLQPSLQSHNALDAWERQDIETARKALRRVLLWDPDRLRLIQADRALQTASVWLETVCSGLVRDEPLLEFITRQELIGRDLRNQIGPAVWLDSLLSAFKQLRAGADPTDVLLQYPESRSHLDWLISLEPRRPLLASAGKVLRMERGTSQSVTLQTISGIQKTAFGKHRSMQLHEPLDTWTPEARGSSARLFAADIKTGERETIGVALKLMRPDRTDYALPLFREEAQVLSLMRDVNGVVRLYECGFLKLEDGHLPPEDRSATAVALHGDARRYGLDSIHNFLSDLENHTAEGWLPYLALEKIDQDANLLSRCDIGYTNGRFLPTLEGLIMAIQICDILETAHKRSIIYRDHKILHYYWLDALNGIMMIDWNVAKRYPQGLSDSEIQFDLVQFGARALHPILTGRAAQGALPLGPNQPEEIEAAAHSYQVSWTYDDSRLPKDIKDILAAVLSGEYTSAKKLGEDIRQIFTKLSALG